MAAQPPAQATPAQIEAWYAAVNQQKAASAGMDPVDVKIMEQYGYLAGYLHHPEIGPILRQAAQNGWSMQILQGKLYDTNWWKKTSSGKRELELLKQTDPAEYAQRVRDKAREIQSMGSTAGVQFESYAQVEQIALQILGDPTINDAMVKYMVFSHAKYKARDGEPLGTMGTSMDSFQQRAAEYMVPLSDKTAFEWAKKVAMGEIDPAYAEEYLQKQAKARFAHLADDIDRGFTVKEIFDPYIEQTAQLLEKAPNQIDLMQPDLMPMIDTVDQTTGKRRAMTLSEAGQFVRKGPEYDKTQGAMNRAAAFTENLTKTFGKVG